MPSSSRALAPLGLIAVAILTGCATRLPQPITGYTCCNLRPDYGWISDSNTLGGAILPAGQSVTIDTMKRYRYFYGTIGADAVGLRNDTAPGKENALRWLRQIVVTTDPKVQLASWSPVVQKAVYAAKVRVGMTRAQVLMSLSYPSIEDTPDLGANTWRYWTAQDDEPVDIRFASDGTVSGFAGPPSGIRALEFTN